MGRHHHSKHHKGHHGSHHHHHRKKHHGSRYSTLNSCRNSSYSSGSCGKLVKAHDVYKVKSLSTDEIRARPEPNYYQILNDNRNIIVGQKRNGKYVKAPRHINIYDY